MPIKSFSVWKCKMEKMNNRKYVRVENNKRHSMVVAKDKGNNLEGLSGKGISAVDKMTMQMI